MGSSIVISSLLPFKWNKLKLKLLLLIQPIAATEESETNYVVDIAVSMSVMVVLRNVIITFHRLQ